MASSPVSGSTVSRSTTFAAPTAATAASSNVARSTSLATTPVRANDPVSSTAATGAASASAGTSSSAGSSTRSITWMTPFPVATSGRVTVAPPSMMIDEPPTATKMVDPSIVVSGPLVRSAAEQLTVDDVSGEHPHQQVGVGSELSAHVGRQGVEGGVGRREHRHGVGRRRRRAGR